ncbi:hypothetical protein HWV62_28888 [Athelia sp. TMB]|nr:hypothetical protein HWV62_28888 [Athelia sp. TMB]
MLLPMHFLLLACVAWQQTLGAVIPIPDDDPFYQPPAGFETSPPGTIFKDRLSLSGMSGVTAMQILYRTTDVTTNPTATVATILVSTNSTGDKLVAFNDFEDAANTTCSPSYLFRTGQANSIFGPTPGTDVSLGLEKGWTIVISDYEGFGSAFSAGHLEGHAVLDGLRAALNYKPANISKSAVLGGYGYSGGAIATGWAASLQHTYAPELNIVGWAFGGTPANLTATLYEIDGGVFSGLAVSGIAGAIEAYPDVKTRLYEVLTPAGEALIAKARTQCALDDIFDFTLIDFETTNQTLGARFLYDPIIAAFVGNNTMGVVPSETPTAPVYMYHSQTDEIIPYGAAHDTFTSWCANGASVQFVTETGGTGHLGTADVLIPVAVSWLDLRLSGVPAPTGCFETSVNTTGTSLKRSGGKSVRQIIVN